MTEPIRFGNETYSREELTAEMGAVYIARWLKHIRNGSVADVIRAAADAQRAPDLLPTLGEETSSLLGQAAG